VPVESLRLRLITGINVLPLPKNMDSCAAIYILCLYVVNWKEIKNWKATVAVYKIVLYSCSIA